MHSGILLSLSWKNLRRHRRRSLGSVAVAVVSVLALCVLFGYVSANLHLTRDAFMRWGARGHLIIERPSSTLAQTLETGAKNPIDPAMQRKIDGILSTESSILAVARVLELSGMATTARVTTVFSGIGEDVDSVRKIKGQAYEFDVVAGRPLWMTPAPDDVVLGQGLAAVLGCDVPSAGFAPLRAGESPAKRSFSCPRDPLQLSVIAEGTSHPNVSYRRPAGVMDWGIREVNDRLVVLPLSAAQQLLDTRSVSAYHIMLRGDDDMSDTQQRLVTAFRRAGIDAQIFRWSDRASFYWQVRGILMTFFAFMLSVAIIVAFASLLNSSYMNFMHRKRELASLRCLGYTRRFLLALAALENAWLALIAGVSGVLAAIAVTALVRSAGWMWTPPGSSNAVPITVEWVPVVYVCSVAVLVLLAALAAIIPMRRILAVPIRVVLADK
ncbi:putative ABC transport system permease protein [Paraburkholderia diazotrophica]|uniref:Putative ABC transport system permease protein n=2 Tax=Paraburkholderia diazotrophica TaxID=667676 RepID=A0A1H6WVA5_9BURK|nr:putative ABC transport system permease protein [Paraburkholderia diazotrophica]